MNVLTSSVMSYLLPSHQKSLTPPPPTRLEPLLLSVQTRAVLLCALYGGVDDITSQRSSAV